MAARDPGDASMVCRTPKGAFRRYSRRQQRVASDRSVSLPSPPVSSSHHNHVPLARLRTPCAVLTLQHDELLESEYSPHTFFTRYEWDEVEGVIVGWEDKSPTAPAPAAAPPAAAPAQADPVRAPEAAPLSPLCLRLAFVKHLHRQAQPQPHPHRQWNPSTRR